ncbi:DNA polymerase III subunit beta [Microvirga sp. P5_D2]
MALSVERSALDNALKRVSDTLAKKPIIPVTGFVRAVAENDQLLLQTCDLERQTVAAIPADIDRPGAICLPGDAMRDIVSGFAAGAQVRLESDPASKRCSLASGRSRYRLSVLPAIDLPDIGAPQGAPFEVPGADLKRAISRVAFAVATAQDRTFLWGAHLHIAEDRGVRKLALAATNGFVLSRCFMELPSGLESMPGVTIPTEALATLGRLAPDEGEIRLTISESRISAEVGNVGFASKLIEQRFPDYVRLFPNPSGRGATVDRQSLLAALGRFGALDEKGSGISITPGEASLILSGQHASLGDAREEVEAEIHTASGASAFSCVVSRKYLVGLLSRMTGEHVLLDQANASSPIRILPLSPADEGHDAVVMPMLVGARNAED